MAARSSLYRCRRSSEWQFNMTPLIDVTFLLLTYFMLASHYASAEKPDMSLPRPYESVAEDRKVPDKMILNLLYNRQTSEPDLMFGPVPVASMSELESRIGELARLNPEVEVILRSDRRVSYGFVRQVMEMVAANRLTRLQLVAELDTSR